MPGKRYLFLFLIAFCLSVLLYLVRSPGIAVQAHSNLVRSDPESGSVLAQAPSTVTLEFSEPLDADLSRARLADANLEILVEGPGRIDPADNRILRLDLPELQDGAYNVIWQARSTVDGHVTSGVVTFSIGEAATNISLLPPPGAWDPTTARPPAIDTLIRWLSYLAAAMVAGSFIFGRLVWRPAYRAWGSAERSNDQMTALRIRQLAISGIAGLVILSLAFVQFQAWQATQGVFQISYSEAMIALIRPLNGWVFWVRIILLGELAYLALRLSYPGTGETAPWWVAIGLSLAVLLTFSLQSHTAALDNPLAVAIDWLHVTAMAVWFGGLICLALLLRQTEMPASLLVPRFSRLALTSVGILAISGLFSVLIQVRTFEALTSTIYGEALILKSLFFALMIGLGALNLLVISPRLVAFGGRAVRWLRNTVRTELGIAMLILIAASVMTGVTPAFEASQARGRMGFVGEYRERGVGLELWIAPVRVGDNEIAVNVSGLPEGGEGAQPEVILRFQPIGVNLGTTQAITRPSSPARYTTRGSYLSVAGDWEVEVILRRAGENDIRHTFEVSVQPNPILASLPNPFPPGLASTQIGAPLYAEYCLPCHGSEGKGDGPAGLAMNPPPADLTIHTAPGVHPDGQLFEWITNGFPGSVMPAFSEILTEEQRWHMVNYIRTFAVE
jgi:copper transport protein